MFCLMLSLGKLVFTTQFQSKTWKSFEWLNSQIIFFFLKSSVLEAFNLIWSKRKGQWLENCCRAAELLCVLALCIRCWPLNRRAMSRAGWAHLCSRCCARPDTSSQQPHLLSPAFSTLSAEGSHHTECSQESSSLQGRQCGRAGMHSCHQARKSHHRAQVQPEESSGLLILSHCTLKD